MQHLLYAAQHSVTREEMVVQFSQAERIAKERFDQLEQRFEQAEQLNKEWFGIAEKFNKEQFNNLNFDIKGLSRKHDRLVWAIFAGMLALFFKDIIMKMFI